MKKYFLFISSMMLILFASCSNGVEDAVNANDYSQIIEEAEPYISPGMQRLINKLDTATTTFSAEEVMPFLNELINQDSLKTSNASQTRAASIEGTTVLTGYNKTTTLFSKKKIVITLNNSALRNSLNYIFKFSSNSSSETVYITCKAVSFYVYFSDSTSIFENYTNGDYMGLSPDGFAVDITNDSSFDKGYHIEEKKEGRLYYLTTYIIGISDIATTNEDSSFWLPEYNTLLENNINSYCSKLEWRFYKF
jgi:hypothetical protein